MGYPTLFTPREATPGGIYPTAYTQGGYPGGIYTMVHPGRLPGWVYAIIHQGGYPGRYIPYYTSGRLPGWVYTRLIPQDATLVGIYRVYTSGCIYPPGCLSPKENRDIPTRVPLS